MGESIEVCVKCGEEVYQGMLERHDVKDHSDEVFITTKDGAVIEFSVVNGVFTVSGFNQRGNGFYFATDNKSILDGLVSLIGKVEYLTEETETGGIYFDPTDLADWKYEDDGDMDHVEIFSPITLNGERCR